MKDISQQKISYDLKAKFVEKQNLHISLKFLGNLDRAEIEEVSKVLQNITSLHRPLAYCLSQKIGVFPNSNRLRVIWLGIGEGNSAIYEIFQSIEKELKNKSFFKADNQFTAHITLARVKYISNAKGFVDYLEGIDVDPVKGFVNSIDLMESELSKIGPEYRIIKKFPLLI